MRTTAIALLLLTACVEHGQTPPVEPVTLEATFQPQFCTAGNPGDPGCGVNGFELGDPSLPSGSFTLRVLADRFEIPDLTLFSGDLGWLITHVQVSIDAQAWEMETNLDLERANSPVVLPLVTLPTAASNTISLRFETLPLP